MLLPPRQAIHILARCALAFCLLPGCGRVLTGDAEAHLPPPPKPEMTLAQLQPPIASPVNPSDQAQLPEQLVKTIAEGQERLDRGDYRGAISQVIGLTENDPNLHAARRIMGLAYARLANRTKGLEHLRFAVGSRPNDLEAQLALGRMLAQYEKDEAIITLRTALKCTAAIPAEPQTAEALFILSNLLQNKGYFTAAIECLTELKDHIARHGGGFDLQRFRRLQKFVLRPERLLTQKGRLLLLLNKPDQAATVFRRSYRRDRTYPPTASGLVESLVKAGRYRQAEQFLGDLQSEPSQRQGLPQLVAMVTGSLAEGGRPREGVALLARLLSDRPELLSAVEQGINSLLEFPDGTKRVLAEDFETSVSDAAASKKPLHTYALHFVLGQMAMMRGKNSLAIEQFELSIRAKKDFPAAFDALLDIYLADGDTQRVTSLLRRVHSATGEGYFSYYLRGKAALAQGDLRGAMDALTSAGQHDANHLPTLTMLADVQERFGHNDEAIATLTRIVKLSPTDIVAADNLCRLYMSAGEYRQAAHVLDRRPDGVSKSIMLARLQLAAGRRDIAAMLAQRLRANYPDNPDVGVLAVRVKAYVPGHLPRNDVFNKAVVDLQEIIDEHDDHFEARLVLGRLLQSTGDDIRAVGVWEWLYRNSPARRDIAHQYIQTLLNAEQYSDMPEVIEHLLVNNPEDVKLQQMLVEVLVELGRSDEAIRRLEGWLAEATETSMVSDYRLKLLRLYASTGQVDRAHALADEWIASTVGTTELSRLRGAKLSLYPQSQDFYGAIKYTQEWIANAPKDTQPKSLMMVILLAERLHQTGLVLLDEWIDTDGEGQVDEVYRAAKIRFSCRAGRLDQAIGYASDWITHSPDAMAPRESIVMSLAEAKNPDLAMELVDAWITELQSARKPSTAPSTQSTQPATAPADRQKLLAWCMESMLQLLIFQQEYEQALSRGREYLKIYPRQGELWRLVSTCYSELGRFADAQKSLERASAANPNAPGISNNLAYLYANLGVNLDRAEGLIRKALQQRPNNLAFLDTLGWVLYKRGRLGMAGGLFREILRRPGVDMPDGAVFYDHAGDVYYRLGWKYKAAVLWRHALRLARESERTNSEIRHLLSHAPDKIQAVEDDREPKLAPLAQKTGGRPNP